MKNDKRLVAIPMTAAERAALKAAAEKNTRKVTDQVRLYIREGLARDGITPETVEV